MLLVATYLQHPSSLASSTSTVERNERKDVDTQLAPAINASTIVSEHQHEDDNVGDDDDDDFGEFSDFKQPEATVSAPALSTATSLPTFSMESVQKLLEAMFPSAVPEPVGTDTGQQAVAANHIPTSKLHTQLQDFDNTSALAYQYSKSSSSKTLVTALGIDSRNIVSRPAHLYADRRLSNSNNVRLPICRCTDRSGTVRCHGLRPI